MKHTQFFADFLSDEVNLNRSRLERLNKSANAVSDFSFPEPGVLQKY